MHQGRYRKAPEDIEEGDILQTRLTIRKILESPFLPGGLLAALMIQSLPLMLCMPLTADAVLYDLQAKTALQGGLLYRDIVEPNLPGIVWLHMIIRSIFGWSVQALRLVDLTFITAIILLLVFWQRADSVSNEKYSRSESIFLAFILFWFYFGTSEWCHCQRDVWMLLPALVALYLRRYQIERLLLSPPKRRTLFQWSMLEGIVWAVGFWIKPFIAIPALAVLAVGITMICKRKGRCLKRAGVPILFDLSGLLAGGLLIGSLGIAWLLRTGAWPYFLEMLLQWNPTYFEAGSERWTWDRLGREQLRFMPFSLFHLLAIPLAIAQIGKMLFSNRTTNNRKTTNNQTGNNRATNRNEISVPLLSGMYVGWLLQSFTMQHLFDYVHVPEILLGMTLVVRQAKNMISGLLATSSTVNRESSFRTIYVGTACFLVFAAWMTNPATKWSRTRYWKTCLTQGSTPEVKMALQHFSLPNWIELQPALEYLRQLNLHDQELTVHNVHLVHAYRELNLKPSTRFVYLDVLTRIFYRDHAKEIVHELDHSGHRYVLSGLVENGMPPRNFASENQTPSTSLPTAFPSEHLSEFPYHFPVVFRSGQYVVHRVDKSVAPLNASFMPLTLKTKANKQETP